MNDLAARIEASCLPIDLDTLPLAGKVDILQALFFALRGAIDSLRGTEDGGTCNLDTPYLRFTQRKTKAFRELVESAARSNGIEGDWCAVHYSRDKAFMFGGNRFNGMADRRSKQATACRRIAEQFPIIGMSASVWYRMD